MKVESDKPENTIIEEMQKGFLLNNKVIRHAKVKVSAGKIKEKIDEQKIAQRMVKECSFWKDKFFFFTFVLVIVGALAIITFRIYYSFPQGICPYLSNSFMYC